jgi:DNA-binding CsgD family transcriptional regulator
LTDIIQAGRKGGSIPKHRWTEEERDVVRTLYRQDSKSAQLIADRLGVTFYGVKGQVQLLGISKRTGRRWWHTNNDAKLRKLIPQYAPVTVAKMMNCSIGSVINRAKRLGLSRRSRDGWYTKKDICEILGIEHKRVQTFIDSGVLPATYHHGHRPSKNGSGSWHITKEDLRTFIRNYPEEFNGRQVDLIQIVEILVGLSVKISCAECGYQSDINKLRWEPQPLLRCPKCAIGTLQRG